MINVEIVMPFENNTFLISCEEELLTDGLMDRIKEMIFVDDFRANPHIRNQSKEDGRRYSWLCHIEGCHLLGHNMTISESGLREGSSLVLI